MVLKLRGYIAKARGFGSNAIRTAQELAPHVRKAADVSRMAYQEFKPMIDKSKHADKIHSAASRASHTYDKLSEAASAADRVAKQSGMSK